MVNSLTGQKELFIPRVGNRVLWYTCGPTVYDVCHMGHARAYLTMDIMRRIMEDYFAYEVFLQVNVTDIDDKIIKRARQNRLLDDYIAEGRPIETVRADVQSALSRFESKMLAKKATLEAPLGSGREEEERVELLKQHLQKLENFAATKAAVASAASGADASALARAASEPLSESLDADKGSCVTDKAIFNAHARRFEESYMEDMDALHVKPPDSLSRVTEYVPQIVEFIKAIVDKGLAYESNGSVYMDICAFRAAGHEYPKLEPSKAKATEAEMEESEGAHTAEAGEKRGKGDFALWKRSKGGEPAWESPWGGGRPGWHIECSVMATEVLGENLDMHGGGVDLKFPHHDNELCQAEAYHGCAQWVNYFVHFGHLHIKGLKMAKSLKNFITIRQALEKHSARQMRIMFLLQPWDKPINFSDQTIDDAKSKENTLNNYFGEVKAVLRSGWLKRPTAPGATELELQEKILSRQAAVHAALCDNFNTPAAMSELLGIAADSFAYMRDAARPDALLLRKGAAYVTHILRVFGVCNAEEVGFPRSSGGAAGDYEQQVAPIVSSLVEFRDAVRASARETSPPASAMLALCDQMRDTKLVDLGIRLEDREGGALWKLDDPETMRKEMALKEAERHEAAATKAIRKLELKVQELKKEEAAAVPPERFFQTPPQLAKYAQFDAEGKPGTAADGSELSKAQKKEIDKLHQKQSKEHAKHLEKIQKKPNLIAEMRGEAGAMRAELVQMMEQGQEALSPATVEALRNAAAAPSS